MIEPPYGTIWECLKKGEVVPFLGAGASRVECALLDEKKAVAKSVNPPSGVDLAHLLADKAQFPSREQYDRDDLAKVASYYVDSSGRTRLREKLHEVFSPDRQYPFGPLHEFLAAVPACLLIVVTNYDTLVEQAFKAASKPYDLVIYNAEQKEYAGAVLWWRHGSTEPEPVQFNKLSIDLEKTTVIYKMHGTVFPKGKEADSFVITEEDYAEFLSRMTTNKAVPKQFVAHFKERNFLFLGYSLRDWNLRVILRNLTSHLTKRKARNEGGDEIYSWAIQQHPSDLECKLWEHRGVNIYDLTLDKFVLKMQEEKKREEEEKKLEKMKG